VNSKPTIDSQKAGQDLRFRFVTTVWGEVFTDLFLKLVIPNQLSPGNLPALPNAANSKYLIFTTAADAEIIKQSRSYQMLSDIIPTEFRLIDDKNPSELHKYTLVTECQKQAMNIPEGEDWVIITLSPDEFFADGTLSNVANLAAEGKRAVMLPGIRLVQDTFVPEFLEKFYNENSNTITVSPRDLVKLALEHLHPRANATFWDAEETNVASSELYWNVPNEGVLARVFAPQPFMIHPPSKTTQFSGTIDGGDYVLRALPNLEDIYVVEDSDYMVNFSVSSPLKHIGGIVRAKQTAFRVARYAAMDTNPHQRRFVSAKMRYHHTDLSPAWEAAERESDRVISSVLFLLRFRYIFLIIGWRRILARLSWRLRNSRLGIFASRKLRQRRGDNAKSLKNHLDS